MADIIAGTALTGVLCSKSMILPQRYEWNGWQKIIAENRTMVQKRAKSRKVAVCDKRLNEHRNGRKI